MPRKQKEDIKQKILNTATELFAAKGFDATGIDLIAKTAGITKSLIYYYFNGKDEILAELFEDFVKKSVIMKQKITDIWKNNPSLPVNDIILQHSLPFMMAHKNVIKIAFTESVKEVAETPHLNIFKYFDQNFNAGYALAEKMGLPLEKRQEDLISGFFMFFAPLFSFVIFSDEWCEHYQLNLDTVSQTFARSFGQLYSSLTSQRLQQLTYEDLKPRQS